MSTRVRALLGTLLLAVLAAAPARAQVGEQQNDTTAGPGAGVVLGRVVDGATLAPLRGATVRLSSLRRTAVTDSNGVFTLRGIPPGDHPALVSRLGYQTVVSEWRVGEAGLELEVPLRTSAVQLAEIRVEARRFDRRVYSSRSAVRAFTTDQLAGSTYPDASQFVRGRMMLTPTVCGSLATGGTEECLRVRGVPTRVCVIVDERPAFGGFRELELYRPQELFRVDVLGGGRVVQVYTRQFVEQMSRRSWTPMSADQLSTTACI